LTMDRVKGNPKIAIVGGGIAGGSAALYFSELGLDVTLFEKETSLVNGPPWCHLHAGGNLYPDISDEQCITLLRQSIDFLRFYPEIVDYRPTIIALPSYCTNSLENLLPRLEKLQKEYERLIRKDSGNKVLGETSDYFRLYDRHEIEALRKESIVDRPSQSEEWMIPFAKYVDLETVRFPVVLVQEYGLNLFRAGAQLSLGLEKLKNSTVKLSTYVTGITKDHLSDQWIVEYQHNGHNEQDRFDYLINAAGFRTGKIDDMIGAPCQRMVEFKAAYVSRWEKFSDTLWPEVVFHGERGTPRGMGQFTPYPGGYFQLHGMTKEITLYEDGLVANTPLSCQPQLGQDFMEKIENTWSEEETKERTQSAIYHLSRFIPEFSQAEVGSKPLFGAQQIPGDDPTLRVAEVSFPVKHYARCEIVKVSSVLDMIDAITKEFITLGYLDAPSYGKRDFTSLKSLNESDIQDLAQALCQERGYPKELGQRNVTERLI
jgi:glycine/D-amino acid oxidase-like deaminating enzyme